MSPRELWSEFIPFSRESVYTLQGSGLVSGQLVAIGAHAPRGRLAVDEPQIHNEDEAHTRQARLQAGAHRTWSGFSNFAISFSIISILAGCFTTFGQAWGNGGPIAISWGWPLISIFILIIGFTMSELVSAYPTSGGIYWWASKLGGPAAGFFTGWLNLIGLIAVTASVAYGAANFVDIFFSLLSDDWAANYSLKRVFIEFLIILALAALANIFSSHLLAVINNISVWWHVAGAALIIGILIVVPDNHQSIGWVFSERVNNSGYDDGSTSSMMFWFLVMPLGFLLTQYTITGFDASAHLSEETDVGVERRGQGHLAVDLLLRRRRLDPAARAAVRGAGQGRRHRGPQRRLLRLRRDPRTGPGVGDGTHDRDRDLRLRPAVLHHGVPHQRLPDDVRVQSGRRHPGLGALVQGQRQEGARPTRSCSSP